MTSLRLLCLASLAGATALAADAPATLADALARGKFSANLRARYEHVDQTALQDADALTLRTRLGYTTAAFRGFTAMVEGENVAALDGDAYNQSGLNPAAARRAVVADPETTELNQAWLAFTSGRTTATLGRQRLVLDNARFVGDVGWRQNQQTFDAFVLQDKSLAGTTLTYAYVDRVQRVFGSRHPQGHFDSSSHLANASRAVAGLGTVTAYAYLLDFDNAPASSCATYGLAFAGDRALAGRAKLTYRAEYARQTDYGASRLDYAADYVALEGGLAAPAGSFAFGYEELGSAAGGSFRTPLATLHAFNGWADLFLTTPGNGLRDTYAKASATLPAAIAVTAWHHWFAADRGGADYGRELDLQASRKFGARFAVTAKYARFERELASLPDVTKLWLQMEFAY
jgi:hypothetical protein